MSINDIANQVWYTLLSKLGWNNDLCGYCGIASVMLHKRLKEAGYNSKLAYHDRHIFNVVDDDFVDITASQFGSRFKGKFLFSSISRENFHHYEMLFDTEEDLINHQKNEFWPDYQIGDENEINRILQEG